MGEGRGIGMGFWMKECKRRMRWSAGFCGGDKRSETYITFRLGIMGILGSSLKFRRFISHRMKSKALKEL